MAVSCTGVAPITCPTVTSAPTVTPQPGSPVWGAIYSSLDCETDTFLADGVVDVDNGGCLGTILNGVAVSMQFTCAALTSESSWSAGVYITDDCSGFKIVTLSAADACSCGGLTFSGYTLGAHVNCGGEAEPTCDGGGGEGEDGSNSNGEGSSEGMDSTGILLVVILVMGFLLALLLVGFVYNKKCRANKDERMFLSDEDFTATVDKDSLFTSEGDGHPSSL